MKHAMKISIGMIIILLGVLLIGCSAEDGADGAIGPQGEQGPAGQDGQDGQDGNANVIVSEWFGPDGQVIINNSYTIYTEFERDITDIDPDILNTGTILVYARLSNFVPEVWPAGHVALLPITVSASVQDHHYTYYFSDTNLKIRVRRDPLEEQLFSPSSRFRYMIIPAGNTRSSEAQAIDFHKMTYSEVMDHFGLK
ncbi:hypothetical protein [Aquimarina celericrescens]|uniref:Collagen-like protein n=1 Tax=Aquimarina celericrescens TaxID=1964542 RepID=A0ABW5ATH9_9FLAO|nr:hypothetical protein [Aquimarina celericrescens]